jgi:hypothetical protein
MAAPRSSSSSSSAAFGRLSVLSQQLSAAVGQQEGPQQLTRAATAAAAAADAEDSAVRPAPGGGTGTLTVLDNRTGKRYTVSRVPAAARALEEPRAAADEPLRLNGSSWRECVPCHHASTSTPLLQLEVSEGGTINAQALKKITAGGDGVGLRTYDPGCVAALRQTVYSRQCCSDIYRQCCSDQHSGVVQRLTTHCAVHTCSLNTGTPTRLPSSATSPTSMATRASCAIGEE